MKRYIITAIFSIIIIKGLAAQVDRSKAPISYEAPEIRIKETSKFKLNNGLQVILVEKHTLPQVRLSLTMDRPPIKEGEKAGYLSFMRDMFRAGTTRYTKDEIDAKIDETGSVISFGAGGGNVSSLTDRLEESVALFSHIIQHANFTNQRELDRVKKETITALALKEKDPNTISSRVSDVLLYGKNSPYGEYITKETVNNIKLSDFEDYYNKYFNTSNLYLIITGDITLNKAKKIANKYFGFLKKGSKAIAKLTIPKNISKTEIDLVHLPTATQSLINIINLASLKRKNSDFFAASLVSRILGGGASARLFLNLREKHGWTYGAYGGISSNRYGLGSFQASAKVRNEVTDSAVVEFMKEINKMVSEKPTAEEVKSNKAKALGAFALSQESPNTAASQLLNVIQEDLPEHFYDNYLKNLNVVTSDEILLASKKHIKPNNMRVVIVGKADEILPGLRKLGYPIHFYDKWGNQTTDPTIKKSAGNITAQEVIDHYFKAIGGKDKISAIQSIKAVYHSSVQGQDLEITRLVVTPNKLSDIVKLVSAGIVISKSVFDGEKGYQQSPQGRKDFDEKKISELKAENTLFPQLVYINPKLKGISQLNEHDVYEIQTDKTTQYYNIKSGLLEKEVRQEEAQQGQKVFITTTFKNYKEVNGVKIPYTNIVEIPGMPSTMKSTLKSIKFNVKITESDFQ